MDLLPRGKWISPRSALLTPRGLQLRGDGPPFWLEGKKERLPETAAEAANTRRNLINLLRRYDDPYGERTKLAERLETCARSSPCLSGACPVCVRALQPLIVHVSLPHFREPGAYSWVTCICATDSVEYGALVDTDVIASSRQRLLSVAAETGMRA